MPVKRGHQLAIIERRQKVADLYLQAWTQTQIAGRLGCAQTTVSADLIQIRREWRASAVRDFDEAREIELRKIDRVGRQAWADWERSQPPAQSARINDEAHQRRTRQHVRNQYGDPRFLEQVNKCIAIRCALSGLGAPRGEDIRPIQSSSPFFLAAVTYACHATRFGSGSARPARCSARSG